MPNPRETILAALHARLSALLATALRGEVLPERVPAEGLLILRDGEPGEPEVTLSPPRYHYRHRAEIEAVVRGADSDAAFDSLTASIGAALAADRTLCVMDDRVPLYAEFTRLSHLLMAALRPGRPGSRHVSEGRPSCLQTSSSSAGACWSLPWRGPPSRLPRGCEGAMSLDLILGGGLAGVLLVYFLVALLAPERF